MKDIKKLSEPQAKMRLSGITTDVTTLIIGSLLYGVSMNMFLQPGGTVLGGATGISTTLNFLFGLPIGVTIMVINIPLLVLNVKVFGIRALMKTIAGLVLSSVAMDTLTFLPVTITDPLLCAIFGGAIMGTGAGMLFSRGFTTGGSDLVSAMLKRKVKRLSTGNLILIIDLMVICSSAIITVRYAGILYSLIASYSYMLAVDYALGGADKAKLALIVSPKYSIIADEIFNVMGRGVTVLYGRGWYTKEDKCVLMCVVKKSEVFKIKQLIHTVDPEAFIILSDATEVLGIGFKNEL